MTYVLIDPMVMEIIAVIAIKCLDSQTNSPSWCLEKGLERVKRIYMLILTLKGQIGRAHV